MISLQGSFTHRPVETGGLQLPQIFVKVELLPIDNYSEKKKKK